ncbi:MAG: hypothetical protein ACRD3D_09440 [Terriglobia bacterium]
MTEVQSSSGIARWEKFGWNRKLAAIVAVVLMVALVAPNLLAQGCIVARSTQQVINPLSATSEGVLKPENQGGYLAPHQWELTVGFRHQYSYMHFVGSTYQEYRREQQSQVMNKINIPDFNLTYQATPRWSLTGDVPILFATRHSQSSPIIYGAEGIGDTVLTAQSWIWSPTKPHRGNISIGFGMQLPTGNDDVQNTILNGGTKQPRPVDFSVQPGSGGWGLVGQFQAFHLAGKKGVVYADGSYTATPQDANNVNSEHHYPAGLPAADYLNSITDEYLAEAGYAYPIERIRGLVLTFGPRDEGVPVRDIFGKSDGFRRPGYAVSLEPGMIYSRGKNMYSVSVGKAIYRTRERNVPETAAGIPGGDAAFANYVWLASVSHFF